MEDFLNGWLREGKFSHEFIHCCREVEKGKPGKWEVGAPEEYLYEEEDPSEVIREVNQMHKMAYYNIHGYMSTQIIDARPASRYNALEPEPRPGVRSGHIPGAKNLPFPELIN